MTDKVTPLVGLPGGGPPIIGAQSQPQQKFAIIPDEDGGRTALPWVAVAVIADQQVQVLAEVIAQRVKALMDGAAPLDLSGPPPEDNEVKS